MPYTDADRQIIKRDAEIIGDKLIKWFLQFQESKFTLEGRLMEFCRVKTMAIRCAEVILDTYAKEYERDEMVYTEAIEFIKNKPYDND